MLSRVFFSKGGFPRSAPRRLSAAKCNLCCLFQNRAGNKLLKCRGLPQANIAQIFYKFGHFLFAAEKRKGKKPCGKGARAGNGNHQNKLCVAHFCPLLSAPKYPLNEESSTTVNISEGSRNLSAPKMSRQSMPQKMPSVPIIPALPF